MIYTTNGILEAEEQNESMRLPRQTRIKAARPGPLKRLSKNSLELTIFGLAGKLTGNCQMVRTWK